MKSTLNLKKYLTTLAEPNRFAILRLLKNGEKCACEIHPQLKLSQNLCSHHLKALKDIDLLKSRREGTKILYSRNEKVLKKYQSALMKIIM